MILVYISLLLILVVVLFVLNFYFHATNYYGNQNLRIRNLLKIKPWHSFDIVNLGSSQPHFGFDYSEIQDLRGYNLACYPQYFDVDYALLRQYSKNLHPGSIVVVVCNLNFFCKPTIDFTPYFPILSYSNVPKKDLRRWIKFKTKDLKGIRKFKYIWKDVAPINYGIENTPCKTDKQFEDDAQGYIDRWSKGFGFQVPSLEITDENKRNITYNIGVLKQINDYCNKKKFRLVFLLPPLSDYLRKRLTEEFMNIHVIQYLKQVNPEVPIINYSNHKEYSKNDWYMSSFFMNKIGRKKMTRIYVNDIMNKLNII